MYFLSYQAQKVVDEERLLNIFANYGQVIDVTIKKIAVDKVLINHNFFFVIFWVALFYTSNI